MRRHVGFGALAVALAIAAQVAGCAGPGGATVREYTRSIRTYPFSDPDPIPSPGRLYPYFRFDGYTDRAEDREWTVVELENAYVKVTILPQIGGKIWSAIEKSTGRAFIYDNRVVKFRDIAMRGPWTSGGIEANYGIIGHTPNCATPVEYVVRRHPDGGASVVIGVLDLLTRTPWRLEVTVPAAAAYFTTRSFWHNATPIEQPYYTWMNAGIKAAGNLQLIYPGNRHLGHGGESAPWPIDPESGRDLSFYEQNDFGPYKSYHVFGRHTEFFGAYWHDDDFGMARYARRDDKLGKKAWIWGLSRQGMIWERLLTDDDGQYVEVQSGRLFNQAASESTATPFKHRGFAPYAAETWTEYWFPVKETRGFVKANDLGALNVERAPGRTTVRFSPLERKAMTVEVFDDGQPILDEPVAFEPMRTWTRVVEREIPDARLRIRIDGERFDYRPGEPDELSRPVEAPADFDWESVYGLHVAGKNWMRQREYARAQSALEACLRKDANYVPALTDLAVVRLRAADDETAWTLARRALSIDTYDPAANYYYALASSRLGKTVDALDGFEVASQSPEYRAAAWTGLARTHLTRGALDLAAEYASRSAGADRQNVEAHQVIAVTDRLRGRTDAADQALAAVLALDPLSHFARFERWLRRPDESGRQAFLAGIRGDLPHETILELAVWYYGLGRLDEAARLLSLSPEHGESLYWLAFIQHRLGEMEAPATRKRADAASPRFVFPFRPESAEVFRWALTATGDWRPRYYLALLHRSWHDEAGSRSLFDGCGDEPDFAPFYAARAAALQTVAPERSLADLRKAAAIEPDEWRYGKLLAERYIGDRALGEALETTTRYSAAHPDNYVLGMLHARTLLLNGRAADTAEVLGRLNVLPYEGATGGRTLHREAQLMLAADHLEAGRLDEALGRTAAAREWPENLGAGKPYPADVDERLEDWVEARCLDRAGKTADATRLLERVVARAERGGAGQLVSALALRRLGRQAEAAGAVAAWAARQTDVRVAAWGRQVASGGRAVLPLDAAVGEELRVLARLHGR